MYLEHYGLKHHPFQITPDVNFFFDSRVHKRALATITYGLSKQEGFVVVTGEVGAGKTTLIEYLLASGDLSKVVVARISTTQLEADNLLELIAGELELRKSGATKAAWLRDLKSFFLRIAQAGKYVLLIVDEVQNLSAGALEELRMLSNFQDKERPLVQQLLVGQPEFRARLGSPECEQIRQRVIASYHLSALTAEEVPVYINHRMQQAGYKGDPVFTMKACVRIHDEAGGVPRKINRLCDRLLLFGFLEERSRIDVQAVDAVAAEMRMENLVDSAPSGATAPAVADVRDSGYEKGKKPDPIAGLSDAASEKLPMSSASFVSSVSSAGNFSDLSPDDGAGVLELTEEHRLPDTAEHDSRTVKNDAADGHVPSGLIEEHAQLLQTVADLRRELATHRQRMERLQVLLGKKSDNAGRKM